jgi:hypothetical protein
MNAPATLSPIDRFVLVLDALCAAVAARFKTPPMTGARVVVIWKRIRRIRLLVQALVARIQAGTYRERPTRPGGARRPGARPPTPMPPLDPLPRNFGWLLGLVPYEAASLAEGVRRVLAEPEMAAMIAATPRLTRLLRPLCWMLHIDADFLGLAPMRGTKPVDMGAPARDRPKRLARALKKAANIFVAPVGKLPMAAARFEARFEEGIYVEILKPA